MDDIFGDSEGVNIFEDEEAKEVIDAMDDIFGDSEGVNIFESLTEDKQDAHMGKDHHMTEDEHDAHMGKDHHMADDEEDCGDNDDENMNVDIGSDGSMKFTGDSAESLAESMGGKMASSKLNLKTKAGRAALRAKLAEEALKCSDELKNAHPT